MAEQKKIKSADLADDADKEILRMNRVQGKKVSTTKRTYHAETVSTSLRAGLGLPPLKMVLVHTRNDRANEAARSKFRRPRTKKEAVIRIIEHLTKASEK